MAGVKTWSCDLGQSDEELREPPFAIPFLYNVYESGDFDYKVLSKVIVVIAKYDLSHYNHEWWSDQELNDKVLLRPDVDLFFGVWEFTGGNAEREALVFVRQWWIDHPVLGV